jgi:hypothetical protein
MVILGHGAKEAKELPFISQQDGKIKIPGSLRTEHLRNTT